MTFSTLKNILIYSMFLSILLSCNEQVNNGMEHKSIENESDKYFQGLGSIMLDIQARHTKLFYAGINENWELSTFILSEMKESFQDITRYHRSHDEINLNKLTNTIMIPTIEKFEKVIEKNNIQDFNKGFNELTESCNQCHSATKHTFIKIIKPKNGDFLNQNFTK